MFLPVLLQCTFLDFGVQVFAVLRDLQKPGLMIDPGDLPLNGIIVFHAQFPKQSRRAHLHAVAQTYRFDAGQRCMAPVSMAMGLV